MASARDTVQVKQIALDAGFARVGVARAVLDDRSARLSEWLARGYHARMDWMASSAQMRLAPDALLPGCRSLLALSVPYDRPESLSVDLPDDPSRGWVSRYAWGDDYHGVLRGMLDRLEEGIARAFGGTVRVVSYVDGGPVMERLVAAQAGLGWLGKNCCLIDGARGSFHFLAVALLDLPLLADRPVSERCGTCRRCLDACPTGALVAPGWLDARRCQSYLTVERPTEDDAPCPSNAEGPAPVFGCDRCQDVCPWNRLARKRGVFGEAHFAPREGLFHPRLDDLAALRRGEFRRMFRGSPVRRAGRARLLRNIRASLTP